MKICGIPEADGLAAAIAAGADAIGFNFVPGSPRVLDEAQATKLIAIARGLDRRAMDPCWWASSPTRIRPRSRPWPLGWVSTWCSCMAASRPADLDLIPLPVLKVLHVPAGDTQLSPPDLAALLSDVVEYESRSNLRAILLDTAAPGVLGGTGQRASASVAQTIAGRTPVVLAGGLDASNVAGALIDIPAVGVDVSSGVEVAPRARRGPVKDPFRVALFIKRASAARLDRPTVAFGPHPVDAGLLEPDEHGRWGVERQFGGRFVPETLMAALLDLEAAYQAIRIDPAFWSELRDLSHHYVGRPTPVYRADRLARELELRAGREPGRLRLYLKREDLDHTGAHKINNALGQALLTLRLGKHRVIAETGAGQHGVATATACALLGLDCVVYMGAEDIRRQAPNVLRMRALGAEVREVTSGTATLKDAVNETMRDWVTNVETSHYILGSAVGPHPFPSLVRDLQRVIGDEAAEQVNTLEGRLPDIAIACVGGGSNAIGLLARFIGETQTRIIGVEAAGEGLDGKHAAALGGGTPGVLHGSRSYLLQDDDGQVTEAHSISAGLDYPGIGPQLSALYAAGRLEILSATDEEALEGVRLLTMTEGILPALEPAHAVSAMIELLRGTSIAAPDDDDIVLMGLSGRGDKDIAAIEDRLMAGMHAGGVA